MWLAVGHNNIGISSRKPQHILLWKYFFVMPLEDLAQCNTYYNSVMWLAWELDHDSQNVHMGENVPLSAFGTPTAVNCV